MSAESSTPTDGPEDTQSQLEQLREQRTEADVTQAELAKELATAELVSVSESTVAGYISEWERGERVCTEDERAAYLDALEAIVAERNKTHPACSNPECNRDEPEYEPQWIDGDPYCVICHYSMVVEPINRQSQSGSEAGWR